ncbi:MAG: AAA family ATPase [Deltaproteobacteria bacterium]|jgi:hypothetical protein|nr:AAA family ATPase [Deltaproteobacteria bacterium]
MALIYELKTKYGKRVAILIDEYDAPLLKNIGKGELAETVRAELDNFYAALKDCEDERGFVFITGVSKFAKTSVFSGLNNLMDLTLDPKYASIVGFTVAEFDSLFKEHMDETLNDVTFSEFYPEVRTVAALRNLILEWYAGYSWDGETSLLNPWDALSFFYRKQFRKFWLETGPPTFLADMFKSGQMNIVDFFSDNFLKEGANALSLSGKSDVKALLFQAGYLTVAKSAKNKGKRGVFLNFPNLTLRASAAELYDSSGMPIADPLLLARQGRIALEALIMRDSAAFSLAFKNFIEVFARGALALDENFYFKTLALAVMFSGELCEIRKEAEGEAADLRLNSRFGDIFVIEITRVPFPSGPRDNYDAKTRELMDEARNAVFERMERKRHSFPARGGGAKIYKTALVCGDRSEILIDFQEA